MPEFIRKLRKEVRVFFFSRTFAGTHAGINGMACINLFP